MATTDTPMTTALFQNGLHQSSLSDLDPNFPPAEAVPQMAVRKRNGSLEPVDVNKIVRAVERCCAGLPHVDAIRVASERRTVAVRQAERVVVLPSRTVCPLREVHELLGNSAVLAVHRDADV